MRWLGGAGLLLLGGLDAAAAALSSPSTWALLVHDPERHWGVVMLRAVFAVGPGIALALSLTLTCVVAAWAVVRPLDWGRPLGLVLAGLHLPAFVVAVPLFALLWYLPDPPRPPAALDAEAR